MYGCYVEVVFHFVAKAILFLCFFGFDIYPYILFHFLKCFLLFLYYYKYTYLYVCTCHSDILLEYSYIHCMYISRKKSHISHTATGWTVNTILFATLKRAELLINNS